MVDFFIISGGLLIVWLSIIYFKVVGVQYKCFKSELLSFNVWEEILWMIQQQKLDKARAILDGINPKHLWKSSRGQYWFLKGNLLLESSLSEAEKAFRHALDIGMKRDEEKAAVMLNLAAIQSSKRRTKEARALIAQAKRLDKKGMLKADIKTIENAINNPQQVLRRR
mgnify:CR=1 FL=1